MYIVRDTNWIWCETDLIYFQIIYYLEIDDVLWIDFFAAILNEAFRSPDHKIFF